MGRAAEGVNERGKRGWIRQAYGRTEHEGVVLGVDGDSQEFRGSIDAAEIAGHTDIAVKVAAQRSIPAVEVKIIQAGGAGAGTEILEAAKDFRARRVLSQNLSSQKGCEKKCSENPVHSALLLVFWRDAHKCVAAHGYAPARNVTLNVGLCRSWMRTSCPMVACEETPPDMNFGIGTVTVEARSSLRKQPGSCRDYADRISRSWERRGGRNEG